MSERDFLQLDLQYSLAYSNQSTEKNEVFLHNYRQSPISNTKTILLIPSRIITVLEKLSIMPFDLELHRNKIVAKIMQCLIWHKTCNQLLEPKVRCSVWRQRLDKVLTTYMCLSNSTKGVL